MTREVDEARLTGTVFAAADAMLRRSSGYRSFQAGQAAAADYYLVVDALAEELVSAGVPPTDIPFLKRMPRNPVAFVGRILADLQHRDLIESAVYDAALAQRTAEMMTRFRHGPYKTYIYPEEGLLLAALADICAPRNALFLGSYYGYWAHWAIPAIVAAGGQVTLVDPNESCCEVARRNLHQEGFAAAVKVVVARGERFLCEAGGTFDFIVLDAENPRDHPEPEQRGKRVYGSLTRACLPHMAPGALFVCHNILFTDRTGDPAFSGIIGRNRDELGPFARLVARAFGPFVEFRTTEGVGIGRHTGRPRHHPACQDLWPIPADLDDAPLPDPHRRGASW